MKKTTFAFCIAASVFAACNTGTTTNNAMVSDSTIGETAIKTADEPWVAVDSATEMKAWMEYATPGDTHKALGKSDGSWTGETTMWMSMDAPPSTSTSTLVNKMVMGGRYQMSSFKGDFMGMPFEGIGTVAYDNYKKKFISTWIDNMGTGIMKMEGTWDDATKSVTYLGSMTNPANGKECEMKQIYKIIDDNHETLEMYGPDSKTGKQYKTMEIKLTRKK